ncbi:MAG TPA: TIGR03086 family metal-binding protein [Acidimicrobiales bacterium]|nr:TIGR03086 family metal-binding protein [Acidimicrobiales bacterium]
MEPLEYLALGADTFRARLVAVGPDQWDAPTPCTDWTVRDLVGHVVGGNRMAVALLGGASTAEAIASVQRDHLGDDPVGNFDEAAAAQAAAFASPGALERVVHHPAGDVPGSRLLGFRLGDLTLHAWDLARATGGDETLDEALVEQVYLGLAPMAPFIAETGRFGEGPSGTVDEDAPTVVRLLDVAGRRP